jgi:hypothetical protein
MGGLRLNPSVPTHASILVWFGVFCPLFCQCEKSTNVDRLCLAKLNERFLDDVGGFDDADVRV